MHQDIKSSQKRHYKCNIKRPETELSNLLFSNIGYINILSYSKAISSTNLLLSKRNNANTITLHYFGYMMNAQFSNLFHSSSETNLYVQILLADIFSANLALVLIICLSHGE